MAEKVYRPYFSTATDARVVRTRQALRNALLELLASRPFEGITIREIAAAAGIGYTTFFRHHPTREALLEEIAADEIAQLMHLVREALGATNTHAASLALCRYVFQHRALWSTLLTGGAASTLRDEFVRIASEVADDRNASSDWLPSEVAIILVASSTFELLAWWLRQKRPLAVEKMATIYERVVLSPVFNAQDS